MEVLVAIIVGLMVSVGFGMAGIYVYWLFKYMMLGRYENRFDKLSERTAHFFKYVFGQVRVIRQPIGVLHAFIFWGFMVLQIETVEYIIRGFWPSFHWAYVIGHSAQNGLMFLQDCLSFFPSPVE